METKIESNLFLCEVSGDDHHWALSEKYGDLRCSYCKIEFRACIQESHVEEMGCRTMAVRRPLKSVIGVQISATQKILLICYE